MDIDRRSAHPSADRPAPAALLPDADRRRWLGNGMALAGLSALAGAPPATAAAAPAATPAPATPPPDQTLLFAQADLNFQASFALGEIAYGAGEAGEVLGAVRAAKAAGAASYQSVYDAFTALGNRLAREAADAARDGRRHTARARHLRSAAYYSQALFFVLGTATPSAEAEVYRTMQAQWAAYAAMGGPGFERVDIPYCPGVTLPAYFIRPALDGRPRPTVILNNGSDAQFVDLHAYGAVAALERGYNVLMFEGPGQGSLLFERGLTFTSDWAGVVSPIVDHLLDRPEVDGKRLALIGWSMGGNLVIRAASREHRLAAVVADPGCLDLLASYQAHGGDQIFGAGVADPDAVWREYIASPRLTAEQRFIFAKRWEIYAPEFLALARAGRVPPEVSPAIAAISAFTIPPAMVADVRAHVLVTDYERDPFFPGQPEQLMAQLTSAASRTFRRFTVAEGAQEHCAPLAPQVRNEAVFDWLDAVLAAG